MGAWALALAVLSMPSVHAQTGADCKVQAGGMLQASGDYALSYTGACKGGLAHGAGSAVWKNRYSDAAPAITWQGRFDHGVYLPFARIEQAQALKDQTVLFDMGRLAGAPGNKGQWWVHAAFDRTSFASPCQPRALHVQAPEASNLAEQATAEQWLGAAVKAWQQLCGAALAEQAGALPVSVGAMLHLHQGAVFGINQYGQVPRGIVTASADLTGADSTIRSLNNKAQDQQRQAQQSQQREQLQSANAVQLRQWSAQVGASVYASLPLVDRNPFRFQHKTVLMVVRLERVLTPSLAEIQSVSRYATDYRWGNAILHGSEVVQWGEESRIVAVKVLGRSGHADFKDWLELELVASQVCEHPRCDDKLALPPGMGLKDGEAI